MAVNDRGEIAVAAGDNETGGYEGVVARLPIPLWIEHLDLRRPGADLEARVDAARPEGALARPAQFDAESDARCRSRRGRSRRHHGPAR